MAYRLAYAKFDTMNAQQPARHSCPSPLIHFENVSVISHGKTLLSEISFELAAGEHAVLTGRSGSGKSTLLKTLLGLYTLTEGCIRLQNQILDTHRIKWFRGCTAYIGQEPLLGAETVLDALLLPFQFRAHREHRPSETRIREVMTRLKLDPDILTQASHRVSGGEKQRIAIARALLLDKNVFLLDEVTSALDESSKTTVFDALFDSGFTVLASTHDPEWSARCDTVFEMNAGRLRTLRRAPAFAQRTDPKDD